MKVADKVKTLVRRRPPTEEELAARAEAKSLREQLREQAAEIDIREGGLGR